MLLGKRRDGEPGVRSRDGRIRARMQSKEKGGRAGADALQRNLDSDRGFDGGAGAVRPERACAN